MLANAPDPHGDFFRVPKIIEDWGLEEPICYVGALQLLRHQTRATGTLDETLSGTASQLDP